MKTIRILTILLAFSSLASFAGAVVENGLGKAQIVLPENPLPAEKFAATELQKCIALVSGVTLPLKSEPKASGNLFSFYIGNTKLSPRDTVSRLPLGGFVLKRVDNGLIMSGNDTQAKNIENGGLGSAYAVYEFLERELKIRWIYPGDDGIAFTPAADIDCGQYDLTWTPRFDFVSSSGFNKRADSWYLRAMRPGRKAVSYPGNRTGHAFFDWYKTYGKTNPDWFARPVGQKPTVVDRVTAMCVSNPGFQAEIVRRWHEASEKEPDKNFILNLKENDTAGDCECETCLSWDAADQRYSFVAQSGKRYKNVGNRYARFYRDTWNLAAKLNPEVQAWAYAYSNYQYPPENIKLNKNIVISIVPPAGTRCFPYTPEVRHEIFGNMKKWEESGASLVYRPNVFSGYAMPENTARDYYDEFQLLRKNLIGIMVDGPNCSFSTQGPLTYIVARLAVHPEMTLQNLLAEYYGGFGKAAPAVKKYWEYWENYTYTNAKKFEEIPIRYNPERQRCFFGFHYAFYAHRLFPKEAFAPAKQILAEAEKAAADSPADRKRVQFLQAGLTHAELTAETCAVFANPKSTNDQKLAAVNRVNDYRKNNLPEFAVDLGLCSGKRKQNNEAVAWRFTTFDPEKMIQLPVTWLFMADPQGIGEKSGYRNETLDTSAWQSVRTDSNLEKQGFHDYLNAWYRIEFNIPPQFRNFKTVLHLGAVDESCVLYVNGKQIGSFRYDPAINPRSWEQPLEFEITDALNKDGKNTIALKVINEIGSGGLWKPSRIHFFSEEITSLRDGRFRRDERGKKLKMWGENRYSFLVDEQPDGSATLKITGMPKSAGSSFQSVGYRLPFKYVESKSYCFGASVKLENVTKGSAHVSFMQFDKNRKLLQKTRCSTSKNGEFTEIKGDAPIHPEAALWMLYFGAGVNEGGSASFKSFFASPSEPSR